MNVDRLLRAALEASDEGIVATNAEWCVVLWNRGAERMFGWSAAEALGRSLYELHMRGADPRELERHGAALRGGKSIRLSGPRACKDGGTLQVESQITPMIDDDGTYVGALGTVRDITPLIESQRALRLSEEKFAKAFHSNPDFTMISRLCDGRIVEANEGFEKLLSVPVAEAVGRMTVADLNMWADTKDRERFVRQLSAQGAVRDFPTVFVTRDGERRDIEITAQTIALAGEPHIIGMARDVTDLKRSRETLLQSEDKFSKAFHASPDWMAISRLADGRFIDVNEGFERLSGFARDEAVGRTSLELEIWADARSREEFTAQLTERGSVADFHYTLRRKDGELRQCLLSSVAIEIGGDPCMISIVRDVTERWRAETERAKSEEKFSKAFHASPDAIIISRLDDGVVVEANAGFERMTGYSLREAIGQPIAGALNIWADPRQRAEFVAALRTRGRVDSFEHDIRRKGGERRHCFASSVVIELGGIPSVITIVRDVTEQQRAEAERAKSEEKFAKVFHASPDGIMIVRAEDGLILDMNESFEAMFGYSRDEAVGHTSVELGFWAFPERRGGFLDKLKAGGKVSGYELVMRTKAGALRNLTTSSVLIDIDGVPCLISIARDVTDRLRVEEEIRNINITLEQRVRDRTAALEEAVREMESFSYSISHDLRAPLRAIAGYAKIIGEDYAARFDEEGRRLLDRIAGGAVRMGELIDDLLDFSRIGRAELKKVPIDMNGLAREVLADISEVAGDRHRIAIGELPSAVADRGLLRQVWTNLLSNAIKYSRQRDPALIEIGGAGEGDMRHYWVRDNGVGFDMAYAGKLFKVFQRLHRDPAFEGTGVGLAIVARIVQRHSGRVWAESAPDAGATFHFTLPSRGD